MTKTDSKPDTGTAPPVLDRAATVNAIAIIDEYLGDDGLPKAFPEHLVRAWATVRQAGEAVSKLDKLTRDMFGDPRDIGVANQALERIRREMGLPHVWARIIGGGRSWRLFDEASLAEWQDEGNDFPPEERPAWLARAVRDALKETHDVDVVDPRTFTEAIAADRATGVWKMAKRSEAVAMAKLAKDAPEGQAFASAWPRLAAAINGAKPPLS